ncbi:MAG: tetratricopeptide repeat-containing glycosyltransferase [Mycobacteriales bacterium]
MANTVGLCMIVKNEAHVIERCLASVRPLIDAWTIVDTGSTDGTQEVIRNVMADVPGELHEAPWRDFGFNRSQALELARDRADYSLVIDADAELDVPNGWRWPELTADLYMLRHQLGETGWWRESLVATRLPWRFVGVLHEYLECPNPFTRDRIDGPRMVHHPDGARSQGVTAIEKYALDAAVLEEALVHEPDNARYQFYLGRSYSDSQQWDKALQALSRRLTMGGFEEEIFDALQLIASIHADREADPDTVIAAYLKAYENRPTRAEPLCSLARYLRQHDRFELARLFAARAAEIPQPDDVLFVDASVYLWRSDDELAVASYWTGHYAECAALCRELLESGDLPESERDRVLENLRFAESKL